MWKSSDDANRWQRQEGWLIPGGESLLIATKAAWGLASYFVKWEVVEREGLNQYPSHLSSVLGQRRALSRLIGVLDGGSMSLLILQ